MTDSNVLDNEGSISTGLLERVRLHEPQAWQRLIRLYTPLICWWCRQAGLRDADIEDVGQEVFAAVHRKVAEFRRERPTDSFRGWLRTITANKIRDHHRRTSQQLGAPGGSSHQAILEQQPEPGSGPEAVDEVQLLASQILELLQSEYPPDKWQAFYRVVVEGQSPAEVAQELGLTVNTVYLIRSRILHRLRDEFGSLLAGDWL